MACIGGDRKTGADKNVLPAPQRRFVLDVPRRTRETKPQTMLARSFAISAQRFAARRLMATGKEIRFGAFL
jgi:hypothetical protein